MKTRFIVTRKRKQVKEVRQPVGRISDLFIKQGNFILCNGEALFEGRQANA